MLDTKPVYISTPDLDEELTPLYNQGTSLPRSTLFALSFGLQDIYNAAMTGEESFPIAEAMLAYQRHIEHVRTL